MSTEIESLELKIVSDSAKATKGIDALTQSLKRLSGATSGLTGVSKKIGQIATATDKASKSGQKASISFTDLYYKLKTATRGFQMVGKSIYSAIQKSSDYVENVNLFTVAMGDYADEAKEYAETVGEALGIDPGEWMRNQGVFMTLATGFGVAGDRAAVMSKNLTQLGYDLSSFFNISYEDAMQKLQSGLSGELEPLRRIGYDLSQAKLEATALELGIDKTVSSMTQAEKAQLRYYAIMTQVTTAQGDMARTLNAPANQLKVFKSQLNMAAREIGNIFIPALNAILPYAIAVTKVIRSLASIIASIVGFEMPEIDYSGVDSMTDAATGTSDAMGDATDSAKKLKSYMMGFDELNVLNPNEDSSSEVGDPLGEFSFELPEYDFLEGLADTRIAEIVDDMKEWLGITEDIDSWSELMDTRLGHILETVGLIGLGIGAWKLTKSFMDGITALKLLLSNPSYAIAIGIILTITGITIAFNGMEDAIKNGLDGFNFAEIMGGSLLGTGGAALLGSKIATWITTAFAGSKVATALTTAATNLGLGTAGAAGAAIGGAIAGIILGIPTYFVGIYDACMEGIDWLSSLLIGAGATAAGAGIGAIIGMLGGPIGAGIGALIGLAVGLVTDLIILIVQNWDKICAWFGKVGKWFDKNVITPIANFFKGLWESVSGFFVNLWEDIVGVWNTVATWFNESVVTPVVNFFVGLWSSVLGFFSSLWEGIVSVWSTVATWFSESVVTPVVEFFRGLWTSVAGFFSSLWGDVVAVWESVATWFDETIIQPIVSFFEGATLRIGQFFEGCWLIIRAVWFVVSTWFNENVIQPIVGFFKGLWEDVSGFFKELWKEVAGFFSSLWEDIQKVWRTVSTWFNTNVIQPIVGFFKGLWEIVAGFFVALWEGIVWIWTNAPIWFDEFVIQPIVGFFQGLWTTVSEFFSSLWNDIKTIWKNVSTWFDEKVIQPTVEFFKGLWESIAGFFSSLWEDIKSVWNTVTTWFDETIIEPVKTAFSLACEAIAGFFEGLWLGIRQGVANAMNGVIGAIESAINWIIRGINGLMDGFNGVAEWAGNVLGESWGGITLIQEVSLTRVAVPTFAEGGFPEQGQMFVAREAGAEMVGSIGRRTAVANNDQIISGIAGGVAEANEEQNGLLREQNSLLRAILEKDSGVYLDGRSLTNSVEKHQRERGRVLIAGGVI